MLIYSNNFAEKLFGYAISRDYLKYSSPFCDLLDDPNLKIDFDLAINFNKGLNGDIEAANLFTEDFIINGPSLDVSTINFYVKKMYQYPIWHPQIERVYYVFGYVNRIGESKVDYNPGESRFINKLLDALKDCLNSPCNYFAATSDSVGKLAEATANTNTGTMPPFKELFGEISTVIGGMGKNLFNKIPEAFQRSSIELAAIGQAAFAESVNMFTKDDKDELIKKAKGKISLRGGTAAGSSIFTTDYKSYLDHTAASTKILEKVAGSMGDCFRQYEQAYRYNPYNADMNLNVSNKSQVDDQNNGAVFERDITGQVVTNGGYSTTNGETLGIGQCSDRVSGGTGAGSANGGSSYSSDAEGITTEPNTNTGDEIFKFTVGEREGNFVNTVTIFGGWYDTEDTEAVDGKTVWADTYGFTSSEGNSNDKNTQAGIGNIPGVFYCPSTPGQIAQTSDGAKNGFVKLINDGWVSSGKVDQFEAKKFNHGVAIITHDRVSKLEKIGLKTSDCVAELSYNGKVLKNVNIIDTGGALDRQSVRLDMTPYIVYQLTGKRPNGAPGGTKGEGIGPDGQPVVEYYTLADKTRVRHRFTGWPGGLGETPLAGMTVRILRKGAVTGSSAENKISSGGVYSQCRNEFGGSIGFNAFRKNKTVVSLDFNGGGNRNGRGGVLVATGGGAGALDENTKKWVLQYNNDVVNFFKSKGYSNYRNEGIMNSGLTGVLHTEPFFNTDTKAIEIMMQPQNIAEYTRILRNTLGQISNVAFIPPHCAPGLPPVNRGGQGAAFKYSGKIISEVDYAKNYLIPSMKGVFGGVAGKQ